jgi:hypothetical protein
MSSRKYVVCASFHSCGYVYLLSTWFHVLVLVVVDQFADHGFTSTRHGDWMQGLRSKTQVRLSPCLHNPSHVNGHPKYRFPPKNAKPQSGPSTLPVTFPTIELAQCEIWDADKRNGLKKPRYKKKDLDERRSKVRVIRRLASLAYPCP